MFPDFTFHRWRWTAYAANRWLTVLNPATGEPAARVAHARERSGPCPRSR